MLLNLIERQPVLRPAILSSLLIVLSACGASDATVGVSQGDDALKLVTTFSRVDLGTLGGRYSYAAAVNNSNTVVGWSETSTGATHAFRWTAAGGMLDLGSLPGDESSRALAVLNEDGASLILGVSSRGSGSTPVVWSASGSISRLAVPMLEGFTTALPSDFNARGQVVGSDANGFQHGWIWSSGEGKYDLTASIDGGSTEGVASAINASGVVLLTTRAFTCQRSPDCWRTYLWRSGSVFSPLGTPGNDAEANVTGLGLNDGALVVGWFSSAPAYNATAYRWSATAGFSALAHYADDASRYGYAAAVNRSGIAVGGEYHPAAAAIVASTWSAAGAIERLSPEDRNPSVAVAVNDQGAIAGWAVAGSANHAVLWQRSSSGQRVALSASSSSAKRVSPQSTTCLANVASLTSKQSLFSCVVSSDRQR
ncbi:MAG TPA: hypothetical protein VGD02_01635 [Gemmatimonadaceae bacterium]|jgi:probable HAF family extracellular repeat protein